MSAKEQFPRSEKRIMHIFLIHSLGGNPLTMFPLAYRLRRQGYRAHLFGYCAVWEPFPRIVERFVHAVKRHTRGEPYALIGHSLGGIVCRAALPALRETPPDRLFMLGPPNQPPMLARRMHRRPLYRLWLGDCGQRLADPAFYDALPIPTIPTTVIAGTSGPQGRFSPFGNIVNDGIVTVEETMMDTGEEHLTMPGFHTLLPMSRSVARLLLERLEPSLTGSPTLSPPA